MQDDGPPTLQLSHLEGGRWAILNDQRQMLFSGSLVQCEDWLDAVENLERLDESPTQIGWTAVAARLPVGAAYLALAAAVTPIKAAGRVVTGWSEFGSQTSMRERSVMTAFGARRTIRRTWRWIFNDSPAPWGTNT